jgi:hypothetical protein
MRERVKIGVLRKFAGDGGAEEAPGAGEHDSHQDRTASAMALTTASC